MTFDRNGSCKREKGKEPLGFKIKMINEKFIQNLNKELKEKDMTFSQMGILWYLEHNMDHKVTQKELSMALQVKHPTTIGLLKRLEEKEMVQIEVDEDNHKYRNISITEKALDFLKTSKRHRDEMDNMLTVGMTVEEINLFRELLDKALDNLKDY